jgi:hypothetical protein
MKTIARFPQWLGVSAALATVAIGASVAARADKAPVPLTHQYEVGSEVITDGYPIGLNDKAHHGYVLKSSQFIKCADLPKENAGGKWCLLYVLEAPPN